MDIDRFLEDIRRDRRYDGQMTHVEVLPGRSAEFGELDAPLDGRLREALRRTGVNRFYSHQATAINAARRGENVITVTSTASGKTLCYNVPVLEDLLANTLHRALYLFPTKALAQDQLGKINALHMPGVSAATFDGDTPRDERRNVKQRAGIVLTNPDMLATGILPWHGTWSHFLRKLRWVVVDEVHTYRGVFGSHVANVLRRLRRLCDIYGAKPQFLFSSATIANPEELARNLTGLDVTLVDGDGSPSGGRRFVFWNPPAIGEEQTARRSTNMETTSLFSGLVSEGVRTIAFARARQTAEIILRYTRNALAPLDSSLAGKITSYRAGYLIQERRDIERRLFRGDLLGVVSTNALELGVDIGGLDACILNGFPGTVASTWQQAGRAGRGADEGLAILVAQDNPLDQYLMNRPDYFFGRPHEHAIVDPGNLHILRGHLQAAAYEAPLSDDDSRYFGLGMHMVVREMLERGTLRQAGASYIHAGGDYPAGEISLRSASGDMLQIRDTHGNTLGTEQAEKAFHTLHPGAIYLHLGESYLVERLDIAAKTAWVVHTDVNYYTQPRDTSSVAILSTETSRPAGRAPAHFGPVRVTNQVTGFVKKQHFSDSIIGMEELDLPPLDFDTEALWLILPEWMVEDLMEDGVSIPAGLHAIEHAAIGLMPLYAMCDRNDIGGVSYPRHPELGLPAVFIHDAHPGGVGIAERTFDMLAPLLRSTRDHIAACPCRDGCPSCIQSPKCGNNNDMLDKDAALRILEMVLGK